MFHDQFCKYRNTRIAEPKGGRGRVITLSSPPPRFKSASVNIEYKNNTE